MNNSISFQTMKKFLAAMLFFSLFIELQAQTDTLSNLNQYLFKSFNVGQIKLKNGTSYNVRMNYNTVTEKMTFYQNGNLLNLTKPETADTIFLESVKFVFMENAFLEILYDAPVAFFIQHRSNLTTEGKPAAYGAPSETASSTSLSKLYNDKAYNLKLPSNFKVTYAPVYWIRVNNSMHRFESERQFLKIFPEKETELKKFIRQYNIKIKNHSDLFRLASYCNELMK